MNKQNKSKKSNKNSQTHEMNNTLLHNNEHISMEMRSKRKNTLIGALAVATSLLTISTITLGVGYGLAESKVNHYKNTLENIYMDNYYNLVDSVNNLENKLAKVVSSSGSTFQRKTLLEASKNASEAELSVAQLPLNQSEIADMVRTVNQISGYTSTLADKLAMGESLTEDELETLQEIHYYVVQLKDSLGQVERKLAGGFSITNTSFKNDDNNEFTLSITGNKNNNIEYPTMIYDGPFSDSVTNSVVKGLTGSKVTKGEASEEIQKSFKSAVDVAYNGQTLGRFETYNFDVMTGDEEQLFVQVTQIGGHILTMSGAGKEGEASIDLESAKKIALEFAGENGIEEAEVVWSDSIGNDVYLNIAPKSKGIILYPDLVKVKVNRTSGTIVGYDATTYFTNHINRDLSEGSLSLSTAKGKVPSNFEILMARVVLSPLDYNREVVCVEVEAEKEDGIYYFYFNASNGELENVLKVVETDDGNLLM